MIGRWVDRFATFCLTYRKTVLAALAAITVVAGSQLPRWQFDNALEIWFLDNDHALRSHQRLLEIFGSDELIMIGLEAPDVFSPEVLARIDRVTRAVAAAPHVEKVFSLTNIESITGEDGELRVGELIEFPLNAGELPAIRERALRNELYVGNVVSPGGDFACIIARLPHRTDDFSYKIEAVGAIREILAREADTTFFLGGGPVLDEQFFYLSERDSVVTTTLMIVLLIVALWLLLHSASGVLLPLATVCLSTVWAMGWILLSGARINVITTMLPPLLLAVGVADAMHILVDYYGRCAAGTDKWTALRETYRDLTLPCLLTSLTTAIGMLSLLVSRVQGIREFGIFSALGVFGAFLLSVTFVPIVLSYLPAPRPHRRRATVRGLSIAALERLHSLTVRRGRRIAWAFVALAVCGALGATRVQAESAFLEYFKNGERIKQDTRRMERALAGTMTLEIMVETEAEGGIKDPTVLRHIQDLQAFLERDPLVSATQSVTDYFKDMRRAFFDNDPAAYRLPETRDEAAQYLLLYEMDEPDGDIQEYVTFDYRMARISARVNTETSNATSALVARTREYIEAHFPPDVRATVTGVTLLYANMEDYIRQSLVRGFSAALIAIFAVLCLQMRSVRLGLVAMIPNLLPIVVCLGVMGVFGIRLDGMTAMVASVAIGLAVDDTIHYIGRARLHLQAGAHMPAALRAATVEMGRALVYTSATLCAGFGVMTLASFVGMIHFGVLCTLTILIALVADLLLLPVVLRWYAARGHMPVPGAQPAPARASGVMSDG